MHHHVTAQMRWDRLNNLVAEGTTSKSADTISFKITKRIHTLPLGNSAIDEAGVSVADYIGISSYRDQGQNLTVALKEAGIAVTAMRPEGSGYSVELTKGAKDAYELTEKTAAKEAKEAAERAAAEAEEAEKAGKTIPTSAAMRR